MAESHHWVYATRAAAARIQAGFNEAEGLPRKGRHVTPGIHGPIPARYRPGAPGWTSDVVNIDMGPSLPREFALQRTRIARRHEGKRVELPDGSVDLPVEADAVERPPEWDPAPAGARVAAG